MLEGVLRHDEVQSALRLDQRKLDADLEHLPHGDVVGSVRLIRDPLRSMEEEAYYRVIHPLIHKVLMLIIREVPPGQLAFSVYLAHPRN